MSQLLPGVDRSTIVKIVAVYFVISAVLSLCGGLALFGLGGFASMFGASSATILSQVEDPEIQEAVNQVGGLASIGILSMILGILSIILAPILLVVAYGLFQRKAWARQGTIIVAIIEVVLSLLSLGSGLTSIVTLVISAFVLYLFMTDEGIKMELSQ